MKNMYIPFELLIKLNEKGFPKPNHLTYGVYGEGKEPKQYNLYWDKALPGPIAPTIEQVLDWLRKEKYIAINIEYTPRVFQYKIIDMSFDERFNPYGMTFYAAYEDAALDGIEYVVDNLI